MRLLAILLLFGVVAFAVRPRPFSTLSQKSQGSSNQGSSKFSRFTTSGKNKIEESILRPWFTQQTQAGARAYAGVARLCFHDAGTFNRTDCTGGAHAYASVICNVTNACEYTSTANAGLPQWVDALEVLYDNNGLSSILSKADFWHLACNFALEMAAPTSAGLVLPFQAGRTDPTIASPYFGGRLPEANAYSEVIRVFIQDLGFSVEETVALMGVHTLGGASQANTGYEGDWGPTPNLFDNTFFYEMVYLQWYPHTVETPQEGQPDEIQHQFSLGGSNFNLSLMFITDMGMYYDFNESDPSCVPERNCTLQADFSDFVSLWASNLTAFYSSFIPAWRKMQSLTCDTLYDVTDDPNVGYTPSCTLHPTTSPKHHHRPGFQPGWNLPTSPPDRNTSSDGWGYPAPHSHNTSHNTSHTTSTPIVRPTSTPASNGTGTSTHKAGAPATRSW